MEAHTAWAIYAGGMTPQEFVEGYDSPAAALADYRSRCWWGMDNCDLDGVFYLLAQHLERTL